ncbi:MAG: glycoside hydrolase family 2 TIM barrel-domain containing protein [Polyangia bacterium]
MNKSQNPLLTTPTLLSGVLSMLLLSCSGNGTGQGGGGGNMAAGGASGVGASSSSGGNGTAGGSARGGAGGGGSTSAASGGASGGRSQNGGAGGGGIGASGGLPLGGAAVAGGGVTVSGGATGPDGGTGGGGAAGQGGEGGPRVVQNLNPSWQFLLADQSGAQATSFDDSSWSPVGLPHTFSLPYFAWAQFYQGIGWYRKHFTVPASWSGKEVFIDFQAAYDDAIVYINGTQASLCSSAACTASGEHMVGYTGFAYDITKLVTTGDNVVAVKLSNVFNNQVAPRNGDHTFSGGLYRDVNLIITDPLHVTWYGTFVTTPTLATNSGASSTVEIKTEIENNRSTSANCTVRTDIEDATGTVVATISSMQTVAAGATVTFDQTTPEVTSPTLWHPDHPTMYQAVTTVSDGTSNVDSFVTPFGFRWMTWSATNGFSLNGSRYVFNGVDAHQDHAGWGDGVADSALHRDVQMIKDGGFNFIRGSHYPHAPAYADACDQIGVLLWSEYPFWGSSQSGSASSYNGASAYPGTASDQTPFDNNVLAGLTDEIRIHRNHPSIVAWSMCNEVFFTGSIGDAAKLLAKEVALVHQLDPQPSGAGATWGPGRPAGIGGAQRPDDSTTSPANGGDRIDMIGDVAGYNGDGATIAMFQNPGIPNLVTEYGSISSTRPGTYASYGPPAAADWRSGAAAWCMFDHGTQKDASYGIMGMVDYFRIPKRYWYWYRNANLGTAPPTWPSSGTPAALKLTTSTDTLTAVDGTQDAWLNVTVVDANGNAISNNVPVTLTVTSGPGEFPTGPRITFTPPGSGAASDIAILEGQAAIEFRTYYSGTSVITATSPGLTSSSVTITSTGSPVYQPGVTPATPVRPYSRYGG